jgi:hypothetical protein
VGEHWHWLHLLILLSLRLASLAVVEVDGCFEPLSYRLLVVDLAA